MADVENKGLNEGDRIIVESSTGTMEVVVRSSPDLPTGIAFTTFQYKDLGQIL